MAIIEYIGGEIKCKHCKFLRATFVGKSYRKVHKCARQVPEGTHNPSLWLGTNPNGWSITLARKKCEHFKYLGE